jgi:DNA-binding winged helix-turn-helix (wHTH) protein/tetratricopeptide (TPR) repeat protein
MTYRFGEFTLDERTRQLRRGNARVHMRAKCFDALQMLVRHANLTVTKSQIMAALWRDREADDASLTQLIYELRRHIEDAGAEMIVTIPSVGYRFTPDVHTTPAGSPLERYVEPVDVFDLYAKGMFLLEKPGKARFMQAKDLFERAVALMPSYAPAYLGLAHAWLTMACSIYIEPTPAFPNGRAAAEQALKLDERLAEAYALLANAALFYDRDWQATAQFVSRALGMNPSLQPAHQSLAWMHIATGELDEAAKIVIKTIEMIPTSLPLQVILAQIYRYRGEAEKSARLLRSILDMDPSFDLARYYLANCLIGQGFVDEGIAELQRVAEVEPTVQVRSSIAYAFAVKGDRAKAQETLRRLQIEAGSEYVSPFALAFIYAGLRDYDGTMRELHRAARERSPWLIFLGVESRFDPLRSRRDFQQLLVDLGLRRLAA